MENQKESFAQGDQTIFIIPMWLSQLFPCEKAMKTTDRIYKSPNNNRFL